MYVNKFTIKNQQKIVSGCVELNFEKAAEWFNKFADKQETIVKVELSSIDIEKIFSNRLFYKGALTSEDNVTYEELVLEDVLDWNIYFPHKVTSMQLGHPIVLKRKLTHDDLHNVIYCFKGTLKAITVLMDYNKLQWSTKANRTDADNQIISIMKNGYRTIDVAIAKDALIEDENYEIIEKIFDVEVMEDLLEDEQVPFKELISKRLNTFTESQDQNPKTYLDDYKW